MTPLASGNDMASLLMIVARDRMPLYDGLRAEFANDGAVDVVLDRRVGQRRREARGVGPEQRRADRRQGTIDAQLARIGWATVAVA